ncbi:hypothetical protein AN964_01695 [Heyndrickxia shackletonii]|uniref:Uncharacterized protein n=1 Tax=Heyndrickxia shackletonii TaxID=157838 RepID=A0A0Q3WUI8_9BACI|nr:hypothetical protein [Heyndrickxia shackletonii]KQL52381.1 hypothetical protein AN964_01695 [Heyndrickxia shackletonii]MBB2479156.1 hypothetical protein [Bacillus sp. APMAM]NEY99060.1 hypothetical protein [Heyndrickxia shackletonii]RTZ57059.1 hypothetical protein EKO25_03865 [Bacillus sp. SAJ1]
MTVQIVVDEIMGGERVEVTLAKYIGLSLTKKDVQIVKNAVKKKDEQQIYRAVQTILQKPRNRKLLN